jgi:hypothetical protein
LIHQRHQEYLHQLEKEAYKIKGRISASILEKSGDLRRGTSSDEIERLGASLDTHVAALELTCTD